MGPQSFDEKQTFAEDVAVHLSRTDFGVSELNGAMKIGTGQRNGASADHDNLR